MGGGFHQPWIFRPVRLQLIANNRKISAPTRGALLFLLRHLAGIHGSRKFRLQHARKCLSKVEDWLILRTWKTLACPSGPSIKHTTATTVHDPDKSLLTWDAFLRLPSGHIPRTQWERIQLMAREAGRKYTSDRGLPVPPVSDT